MRFDLMSKNTLILIDEMLRNQRLVKLIDQNTLKDGMVNSGALVGRKIFPSPFTGVVPQKQETNLRVFFPSGTLNNRVVLDTKVVFQVVLHKDLWLLNDLDGSRIIRPYAVMDEIIKVFQDRTVGTLGVLHFEDYSYHALDKDYGLYNLQAEMMTI